MNILMHKLYKRFDQLSTTIQSTAQSHNFDSTPNRPRSSNNKNQHQSAYPVVRFYPTFVGTLRHHKVNFQICEADPSDSRSESGDWIEQHSFRLTPSKTFRFLGVKAIACIITLYPQFDRVTLDFSSPFPRQINDGLAKALGLTRKRRRTWENGWYLSQPNFTLVRRLLEERKMSPNDRLIDKSEPQGGLSLLEVSSVSACFCMILLNVELDSHRSGQHVLDYLRARSKDFV